MESKQASQFTTGLVVIAIGLMLLAGQVDSLWAWDIGRLWPVIFLVIGVGRFLNTDRRGRGGGVWFLFLGVLFLMHTYDYFRLRDSWPLFIVAAGVSMMFPKDKRHASRVEVPPSTPGDPSTSGRFSDGRFQP